MCKSVLAVVMEMSTKTREHSSWLYYSVVVTITILIAVFFIASMYIEASN